MLLLVVAACAILAGGCARQAGGPQPSGASRAASQPHTTTVTLRDAGRTVTLRVGDRLDVALGTARQTGDDWRLITYPESLLSLPPAPAGHHRFAAYAPGWGTLTADPTPVCAPTDNPNPMLCPPRGRRCQGLAAAASPHALHPHHPGVALTLDRRPLWLPRSSNRSGLLSS